MALALAVVSALLLGFLAGLWTLRAKQRWCASCGANLCCFDCISRAKEVSSGHPQRA